MRGAASLALLLAISLLSSSQFLGYAASDDIERTVTFETAFGASTYVDRITIPRETVSDWQSASHPPAVMKRSAENYAMGFSHYIDSASVSEIAVSVASVAQLGEEDVADTMLSFVQNVGYVLSDYSFEETLYPIETLAYGGACDDLSVLYASMMIALGFRVIFLWYPDQYDLGGSKISHVSVAVHLTSRPEHSAKGISYFTHGGLEYYAAETTGEGWRVGDLPQSLRGQDCYVEEAKAPSTQRTTEKISTSTPPSSRTLTLTSTTPRHDYEDLETVRTLKLLFGYLIVAVVVATLAYEIGKRRARPPGHPVARG